jgi:hypothetical protein
VRFETHFLNLSGNNRLKASLPKLNRLAHFSDVQVLVVDCRNAGNGG